MADPELTEVVERLTDLAASEERQARRVQGAAFKGSEWGADIIEAHLRNAADLRALLADHARLKALEGNHE